MPFNIQPFPWKLTGKDVGAVDFADALRKGFENYKTFEEAKNTPAKLAEDLLRSKLANKNQEILNQYLPRSEEARIGNTEANTGLTKENTYKQQILNNFLPRREEAEIGNTIAQSNYYNRGGAGAGVGTKYQTAYMNEVAKDNPGLTGDQIREAANAYAQGKTTLNDGTQLAPMSPSTQLAFDNAVKASSTAQGINQSNLANQADAELKVFTDLSKEWSKPYASALLNKSPAQILDTFKNDDESQTKLGKVIAANALQFEIAQIRNRIAGGNPGITSTQQLMNESMQHINAVWLRLSAKARSVATDSLNEAITKGLRARNKVGFGAGATFNKKYEEETKGAKGEARAMYKNGVFILFLLMI